MFNIGGGELLVIALIALIAVGPEQLPSVMRKVGGFVSQIRSMTTGLRDEFMSGLDEMDPTNWTGEGTSDDPIVPRGYAENAIDDAPVIPPPFSAGGELTDAPDEGSAVEDTAVGERDAGEPNVGVPNVGVPAAEEMAAEAPAAEDVGAHSEDTASDADGSVEDT